MATEAGSSEMEDPLHGYSYLSLFPRACQSLGVVAKPTELSDLESVHNVLKTMALKERVRHIDQAKRILESSEDMQSERTSTAAVQNDLDSINDVKDEVARKRRPGLGRKQAKFNFNRRISHPAVVKEPNLDISKLEDPEEFFLAHERHENAKKELRKQSGVFEEMDVDVNDLPLTSRPRRPGIPGRSKATYKHHCSSVVSNDDGMKVSSPVNVKKGLMSPSLSLPPESLVLSEETSKQNHQSPSDEKMQQGAADSVEDTVLSGSISEVNGFLDKILSGTYDHLSSAGQLTLLQDQLHIKPINIDNLNLPKLPEIPKYDSRISGNFSKPRKSLLDIQTSFTRMATITPLKTSVTATSVHLSASPTPPRSPFANLSSLKKRILELNRIEDSFSDFNDVPYSVGGSSPVSCANEQPDSVDVRGNSVSRFAVRAHDERSSLGVGPYEEQFALPDLGSEQQEDIQLENVNETSRNKKAKQKTVPPCETTIVHHPHRNDIAVVGTDAQELEPRSAEVRAENLSLESNSIQPDSNIDDDCSPIAESYEKQPELLNICPGIEKVIDVSGTSISNKGKGKSSPLQQHNECAEVRIKEKRKRGVSKKRDDVGALAKKSRGEQLGSVGAQLHDSQSGMPNHDPQEHEELVVGNDPRSSVNKQSKRKDVPSQEQMEPAEELKHPRKNPKRKELSLRKSIAVAGTSFQSGVRRSTRVKMRPLEFWKGERFLYGRLEPDSTLPTLIGIKKYSTPAKMEGKVVLQVVDCVDGEKYRDLIDLAALH